MKNVQEQHKDSSQNKLDKEQKRKLQQDHILKTTSIE